MRDFWKEYSDEQRRIIFAVGLALNAWQRVEAWHAGIYGLTSDEHREKKDLRTFFGTVGVDARVGMVTERLSPYNCLHDVEPMKAQALRDQWSALGNRVHTLAKEERNHIAHHTLWQALDGSPAWGPAFDDNRLGEEFDKEPRTLDDIYEASERLASLATT